MRRSSFVQMSAGWAAALAAGGASALAAGGRGSTAATTPARDVRILNYLLLFEFVQEALYARAARTRTIAGELGTFAEEAAEHERRHVRRLARALGADARARPTTRLDAALRSEGAFTAAALSLEETATAAFIAQGASLSTAGIEAVAPIVSVDARHAAWIRAIAGRHPAPRAADPAKTPAQAMAVLKRMDIVDVA